MVKKELTLRERRRIYEDTINIVANTQKLKDASGGDRAIENLARKQNEQCVDILSTVLGYHETVVENQDGTKTRVLRPEDDDTEYSIDKDVFENVVQQLPKSKELRESLWKSFVKRDKKATTVFKTLVA